nr:MAG TPA: hypothetical protein [Caudoviricetes sp.]
MTRTCGDLVTFVSRLRRVRAETSTRTCRPFFAFIFLFERTYFRNEGFMPS